MTARFQRQWLTHPDYSLWIAEVPSDTTRAKCRLCHGVTFSLSNMGETAIKSHAKGTKHKQRVNAKKSTLPANWTGQVICAPPSGPTETGPSAARPTSAGVSTTENESSMSVGGSSDSGPSASIPPSVPKVTPAKTILASFVIKENVSKAEILWCIETIMKHKSMRSAGSDVSIFKLMFPDSEIATKMQLQKTKIAYSVLYGLAPYFSQNLMNLISKTPRVVIGFDESLNKVCVMSQMDVNVRFWDHDASEVTTRYLTSQFLRRTRASDLRESLLEATKDVGRKKILQLSMDGPNVNHKVLKDLTSDPDTNQDDPVILKLGSCGLHVVHGAFKTAFAAVGWNLEVFLRASHNFLNLYPARRGIYTMYSGSSVFPEKFCAVRWLLNCKAADRSIETVPNFEKMVAGYANDESNKEPTCKSYSTIKTAIQDPLLLAKLTFFSATAKQAESFLREYQTDVPLAPFLYSSLITLTKNLMEKFVKPEVLKKAGSKLHHIDLDNQKNLLSPSEVDLGYATRKAIKTVCKSKKVVTDLNILQFRKDARDALKKIVSKLLERSPLAYKLTKAISCFDPDIAYATSEFENRVRTLLTTLQENNWISGEDADVAARELRDVCSRSTVREELKAYSRKNQRVDHFWRDLLKRNDCSMATTNVMQIVMILSHGNSNLERGFSVNSECLVENMKNETLVAQRKLYDSVMHETGGDLSKLAITKSLMNSYRNARSKYSEEVEKRKRQVAQLKETEESRKRRLDLERRALELKKAKVLVEAQEIENKIQSLV